MTGYKASEVTRLAGITYRQLDHWANIGLLPPSVRDTDGSGHPRLYSDGDIQRLKEIKRCREAGLSLDAIRSGKWTELFPLAAAVAWL